MSTSSRVVKVVCIWAHLTTSPEDSASLLDIWATSHDASVPFVDFVGHLISALQSEFSYPPALEITLGTSDFYSTDNTSGHIKTIQDLEDEVNEMLPPSD